MDPEVCEMIRRGNTAAFIFSTMTFRYKNHDIKKHILPSIKQIQSRVKALKKIEKSRNSLETNKELKDFLTPLIVKNLAELNSKAENEMVVFDIQDIPIPDDAKHRSAPCFVFSSPKLCSLISVAISSGN